MTPLARRANIHAFCRIDRFCCQLIINFGDCRISVVGSCATVVDGQPPMSVKAVGGACMVGRELSAADHPKNEVRMALERLVAHEGLLSFDNRAGLVGLSSMATVGDLLLVLSSRSVAPTTPLALV
ncbi:hypothetical protein [Streptomyces sp. NPDC005970]|uniref:hypothetical protein n=1 Tax=Streptomyces sp. NPDC005970 TaxID=3156723 RepID=UPI0033E61EEC